MNEQVKLSDFLGLDPEYNFADFDLTDVQNVLQKLQETDAIDLSHAELLQQQSLRGADILTTYLGKIVKTIGVLESKINTVKNKVSLEYQAPNGAKTTTDMKIWAGASSPEVEQIATQLAEAKASKMILEKKYDILIKSHHHWKDIAQGLRKTILGYAPISSEKIPEGY